MSVTMTKSDGVTVLTLTSDPKSTLPPICQILKSLCYSPICCSVSQQLKRIQGTSQTILGTLQIMIGLLNIGLGVILCASGAGSWYQMDDNGFPFWLGGLFIFFGAMSILSEKCPSPCLVGLTAMLNVVGIGLAITGIVLYSINVANIYWWWSCDPRDDYYYRHNTPEPPSEETIRRCVMTKNLILMVLRSINAVLIVLSVLELTVAISSSVLGIKALCRGQKSKQESPEDPESYKALLEDVTSNPAA